MVAARMRAHDDAEARHDGEHHCAAIGDERQRHADDRRKAHHHPRIDEHIEREGDDDAHRRQPREMRLGAQRDADAHQDDRVIDAEEHEGADKAELLAEDREDEVCLHLRQELQLALRAEHVALARKAA